jgi:cytolysin-activating lysine-acyltransferase
MMAAGKLSASATEAGSRAGAGLERVQVGTPLTEKDELRIASGVLFLCQYSSLHASYPVEMFNRRIGPSLPLRQFHYYTDREGVPAAFCNWVWLNASVLEDVLATCRDLRPHEFNCGGLPFFYEFLAPFGHCRAVVRDLRGLPFFKGRRIPAIRGEAYDRLPYIPRIQYFQF